LVNDFEKLCWHQEEPFPSSSIYAQYSVFEKAKKEQVTVLLDGQGADEILGGYHRYLHWYMQELISRYKFSRVIREKMHFKKTISQYMQVLKIGWPHFYPHMLLYN
jgi:asparagine synthase (glutamine-hydrolysing)